MAVSEPLWQPFQLAITKQAASVQNSAETRQNKSGIKVNVFPTCDFMQQNNLKHICSEMSQFIVFFYAYGYLLQNVSYTCYKQSRKSFPLCQH